jgi:DNA-binding transcriptional LysR family regulator
MDHVIKSEATMACRHEPGLEALALPSATLDAMKSFIVLADTKNLSEAVRILGLTRQTIRRHINLIEDIRGVVLFTLESGAYRLTEAGQAEFRAVRNIINQASRWMDGLAAISPQLELC